MQELSRTSKGDNLSKSNWNQNQRVNRLDLFKNKNKQMQKENNIHICLRPIYQSVKYIRAHNYVCSKQLGRWAQIAVSKAHLQ